MSATRGRAVAVLEVILVWGATVALVLGAWASPLGGWQLRTLGRPFLNHAIFALAPVLWLAIARRDLASHGITCRNLRSDVRVALSCFFPVAVAGASLGFLPHTRWYGALAESAIQVAVLFAVAHLLSRKLDPASGVWTIGLALVLLGAYSCWRSLLPGIGGAISSFCYYLVLVGFGEEILYRGYMQTRLSDAFGRPFRFREVGWGWGVIVTSLLFGLSHLLNGWDPATGRFEPLWWWAVWTFFGGLVFSYVRERTGSIVAPALLHGLPQALVYLLIRGW